jgi:ornithine carbamoyltransferase
LNHVSAADRFAGTSATFQVNSMRHILTLDDLSTQEIEQILELARVLKRDFENGRRVPHLSGRVLGLLFSKPSLRTRVSFEAGMTHLGGSSLYLGQDVGWGTRESIADFARVISQYLDALVCRTHSHHLVEQLARYSSCPVINGLTDLAHPCQALADVMTLRDLGSRQRPAKLAFVGDGNNVSRSLAIACSRLGIEFSLAAPEAYHLEDDLIARLSTENPQTRLEQTTDSAVALRGATAVYTDVWSSMGFEGESAQRERDFADYQVNARMLAHAPPDVLFMHCLPAHRGLEVTDEVIDGPASVVVAQAANRMHVQKALLVWLLDPGTSSGGSTTSASADARSA